MTEINIASPGARVINVPDYAKPRLFDPATIWGGMIAGACAILLELWFRWFCSKVPALQKVYPPAHRGEQ